MTEQAENLRVGDIFRIGWNKCVVEHIYTQDGETGMTFSCLDNPDDGGAFACRSDTDFSVGPMDRRSTTV